MTCGDVGAAKLCCCQGVFNGMTGGADDVKCRFIPVCEQAKNRERQVDAAAAEPDGGLVEIMQNTGRVMYLTDFYNLFGQDGVICFV